MFENGFPREWSTIKKLALLFRAVVNAIAPVLKTVTGAIIHITDALAKPVQALSVALEPVQSGSGDPSPDNVRPITGWTECKVTRTGENVFTARNGTDNSNGTTVVFESVNGLQLITVSGTPSTTTYFDIDTDVVFNLTDFGLSVAGNLPTGCSASYVSNLGSGQYQGVRLMVKRAFGGYGKFYLGLFEKSKFQTYTIDLDGTRYGGTLDVTSGKLTVTREYITLDGVNNKLTPGYGAAGPNYLPKFTLPAKKFSDSATNISDSLKRVTAGNVAGTVNSFALGNTGNVALVVHINGYKGFGEGQTYATYTELINAANAYLAEHPISFALVLAIPIEVYLTPTEITLLAGTNNLWSNANGTLELTYLADGNTSEIEALNILLGGQYSNNHGEDEPTDREALNILLGGNER